MSRAQQEPLFTPRFAGLWAFAFITFLSAFQLLPAIPFRILELGGTTSQAGWFLSIYTFASAFSAPLMGSIADFVGRRRMLITASLLFIVFSVLYGVITYLPLLLVAGAIHGAIWSGILASSSAIMSEFIPVSRRTEGMAYWGMASTSAVAVAPAIGLWVFHYGWLTLCLEMAVLSAAMAVAATLLPVPHSFSAARPTFGTAVDWRVLRTTLSLTMVSFGYGGVTSYVALLASERHIKPLSLYFTVFASTIILVRIFTSRLGDKYGHAPMLYPALAAIPVAFLILAAAQTRGQLVLSAMIFGYGFGASYPAFAAFILANTDPTRRARTFGSIVGAFDTGIGTGSLVIGTIGEHFGLGRAFAVAAALSCLAIPVFMVTSRQLSSDGTRVASLADDARA